jgi:20S proteasome alpha/beta subunit
MTLVVGFRFADEVIIVADSRRIEENGGAQHDDTEKVFDCNLGIIAAAGELNTIQVVVGTIQVFGTTPVDALAQRLCRLLRTRTTEHGGSLSGLYHPQ